MNGQTNVFKLVIGILLAIIYDSLLIYVGTLIPRNIIGCCLCYICFAISLFLMIKNAVKLIKNNKTKYHIDFAEKIKEVENYKNEINDFNKVYIKIKKTISKFNWYFILILILQAIIIIFGARSYIVGIIFMVISVFINIDLITSLISKEAVGSSIRVDELINYPYIKNIIDNCKNKFGIKDKISAIFLPGYSISVGKVGKKTILSIGALALMILTEEELENILYHEMAHIYNKDTALSNEIIKKSYLVRNVKLFTFSLGINWLLFTPIVTATESEIEMFLHFVKLNRETIADDVILEKGNKQAFINALAKTMVEQYQTEYRCYINVYKYEKPMTNYLDYCLSIHKENYFENKEMYDHLLKNTLIRQFDTHPSLKMRMDKMGIEDFEISFDSPKKEQFEKEVQQIKEKLNKEWVRNASIYWQQGREQYYLIYVREYEKLKDKLFEEMSIEEQMKYAYCNIVFNKKDIALDSFNKILEKKPDNTFSLVNRGFIKFGFNDIGCIDDFKKAKTLDPSLSEQMNFYIGTFYNNNGYEDLIKEYRKDSIIDANKNIQSAKFLDENKYKVYQEHDLPEDVINTIKSKINNFECVQEAYVIKKLISEEEHIYLLCVVYDYMKITNDKVREISDEIYIILSGINDYNISLDEITYSKKIKSIIKEKNVKNLINR